MGENFRKKRTEWFCRRRDRASNAFAPNLFTSVPPDKRLELVGEVVLPTTLSIGDELHVQKLGNGYYGFFGANRAITFDPSGESLIASLISSDDLVLARVDEVIPQTHTVVVSVLPARALCY